MKGESIDFTNENWWFVASVNRTGGGRAVDFELQIGQHGEQNYWFAVPEAEAAVQAEEEEQEEEEEGVGWGKLRLT